MGALQKTRTTLSYLTHKGGTVIGDTTKKENTRRLCEFMNTSFVSIGSENYLGIICVHINKNSQMSYFHGAKTKQQ